MTTAHDIDWPQVLAERLTTTHPDVLRELLATFHPYPDGRRRRCALRGGVWRTQWFANESAQRLPRRQFDTRTGTLDLAIPKLALSR